MIDFTAAISRLAAEVVAGALNLMAQQNPGPQGSMGKWPGGHKPPSLIVTLLVILLLAGAVLALVLYVRHQKKAEREAAKKLRDSRETLPDRTNSPEGGK